MRPYTPKRLCFATVEERHYEVWRTPDAGSKHYHLYAYERGIQTLRLGFATEISARAEFERRVESASAQLTKPERKARKAR